MWLWQWMMTADIYLQTFVLRWPSLFRLSMWLCWKFFEDFWIPQHAGLFDSCIFYLYEHKCYDSYIITYMIELSNVYVTKYCLIYNRYQVIIYLDVIAYHVSGIQMKLLQWPFPCIPHLFAPLMLRLPDHVH